MSSIKQQQQQKSKLAERGFDPRTSGLWAQHASTAPLCCPRRTFVKNNYLENNLGVIMVYSCTGKNIT